MTEDHPNIALMERLDSRNVAASMDLFAEIETVAATPVGSELGVTQSRNTLTLGERAVTLDVVIVWRFADGRIVEVWNIAPGQPTEVHDAGR